MSNETERLVLGIWREVLGVVDIGVDDDFFELGGDSLVATDIVARLRRELNVAVPLLTIFDNPTVREFAREVDELTRVPG